MEEPRINLPCPICGCLLDVPESVGKVSSHCPDCLRGALLAAYLAVRAYLDPGLGLSRKIQDDSLLEAAAGVCEEDPPLAAVYQSLHRSITVLEV